jgi:hypothetical protein
MFNSPEGVMVYVVTIAASIYVGVLWREFTGTKKAD